MARPPFATFEDIETRFPRELVTLAADETTRLVDRDRVDATLIDVATEIRAILAARYTPDQLDKLDTDSFAVLKLFSIDMTLYRVALAYSRATEALKERYDIAVKRLEGIASGKGGLTFEGGSGSGSDDEDGLVGPNEVILVAPERLFTRKRFAGGR